MQEKIDSLKDRILTGKVSVAGLSPTIEDSDESASSDWGNK